MDTKMDEMLSEVGKWSIVSCGVVLGIFFIVSGYYFYQQKHHTAVKLRRPKFSLVHLLTGLIFSWVVIPLLAFSSNIYLWYFWRIFCLFVWFWIFIIRYWVLYFDYQFATVVKIGTSSKKKNNNDNNSANMNALMTRMTLGMDSDGLEDETTNVRTRRTTIKRHWSKDYQKNFNGPKVFLLGIGIYCLLCLISLILTYIFCGCHLLWIETIFLLECLIPMIILSLGTYAVWNIYENWKIRNELLYTFFSTLALLIADVIMTGFITLDLHTVFLVKVFLEWGVLLITTLWSTVWVIYVTPFDHATQLPSMQELALLSNQPSQIGGKTQEHIPLGYILANQVGHAAFVQHCVDEINVENLFFIEQVCYFKFTFLFRTEQQYVNKSTRFDTSNLDLAGRISIPSKVKRRGKTIDDKKKVDGEGKNDDTNKPGELREDSLESNKADYDGDENRRITHMIMTEHIEEEDNADELVWSPSNCLAVLTFRVPRRFFEEPDVGDSHIPSSSPAASTLKKSDITTVEEYNSARNLHTQDTKEDFLPNTDQGKKKKRVKTTLYDIAKRVYERFIVEGSEMEINISSKSRSDLHFFFHQENLPLPAPKVSTFGSPSLNSKKTVTETISATEKSGEQSDHLFKLYHIFDGAWAEIWHLLNSNVYPRFINTDHYLSIQKRLLQELDNEKQELNRLANSEDNTWFEHIKPRKLEIIGVKALPVDEQVVLFGKPMVRVKNAKV